MTAGKVRSCEILYGINKLHALIERQSQRDIKVRT